MEGGELANSRENQRDSGLFKNTHARTKGQGCER